MLLAIEAKVPGKGPKGRGRGVAPSTRLLAALARTLPWSAALDCGMPHESFFR
jgi:hypothetical protein